MPTFATHPMHTHPRRCQSHPKASQNFTSCQDDDPTTFAVYTIKLGPTRHLIEETETQ